MELLTDINTQAALGALLLLTVAMVLALAHLTNKKDK